MFRNYFKVAIRTFLHNKSYSFINVAGLALGLAATVVILMVVQNELSFDRFHEKSSRTYRVTVHGLDYNPSVSFAVAPALRNDFPEFEHVSQYLYRHNGLVKVGADKYNEVGYAFADDQFAQVFDFTWLAGHPEKALKEPNTVVLTESMARKYFNSFDALGKTILLDNRHELQVTGVIEDLPSNTHLTFNFLVSWETIQKSASTTHFWSISGGGYLYVTRPDDLPEERVTGQLPSFVRKNWGEEIAKEATLILQPLTEIHFDQRYLNQISMPRSKESVYALAAVALFIILSACINFVNLATAQSLKRAKEVGVRKTLGAYRKQLLLQVLTETSVLVALSVILAVAAVWAFLPFAKSLLDVRIESAQLLKPQIMGTMAGITLVTIFVSGLYPALIQSRFQPSKALKSGVAQHAAHNSFLRKSLVIVQFSITQILLIGTFIIGNQMDFFLNQNLGFDKEAVVTFPTGNNKDVLKQRLQSVPGVQEISLSSGGPGYNSNFGPFSAPEFGMTEVDVTEIKQVDESYMSMYKLELVAGEALAKTNEDDTVVSVIVNQTLINRLGISDATKAIGKQFLVRSHLVHIKGVVRDFQSESKHKKIRSCVIWYNPNGFWQASVKVAPHTMRETLSTIDEVWSELNPESLFSYEFIDDHIARMYKQEAKIYTAFRLFSGIAIVIGCLGLYGLVSLMGVQRVKEIGVRKVLGASVSSIMMLFFNQFIWLITFAFVFAAPLAWYAMNQWLQEFAYRIKIGPMIFLFAILSTVVIACITISYQGIKAALANPAKSLRSE